MNLSKTIAVTEIINSLRLIKKNPFWLVTSAITDALFILALAFFTGPIKEKITEHAVLISNQMSTLMAQEKTGLLKLMFGPELSPMTGKLALIMLMLFAITYLVYSAFQGTAWWMAKNITEQKTPYKEYLLGFAKINLVWIAVYILYKLLGFILALRYKIIQKFSPTSPDIAGNILLILFVIAIIAAYLSYPYLKIKTLFKTPFKITAQLIGLSAVIYLVTDFILTNTNKLPIDYSIKIIIGIIILMPVFTLLRVYAIRVLSHVHTRN